jgi:hypothetical protein
MSIDSPATSLSSGSSQVRRSTRLAYVAAVLLFVATAAIFLMFSSQKLLWNDEIFVLWTDSVPSVAQLVQIQLAYPISLDPIVYHAAAHAMIGVFGASALAIRLPSMLGFLVMEICLFFYMRRVAGVRAGFFALTFLIISPSLAYAVEGRPYGMMLGMFGVAMVSWQAAVRGDPRRSLALISLALAVALAINTHYYGVLLLVPLCVAESWRSLQRRSIDGQVIASIGIGAAGCLVEIPFFKAAKEFRAHIYDPGLEPQRVVRAYFSILPGSSLQVHHVHSMAVLYGLMALCLSVVLVRGLRRRLLDAEVVFLFAVAALPTVGYLLAVIVTHTFEPRYVIATVIGLAGLIGLGAQSIITRIRGEVAVLAVVGVIFVVSGGHLVYSQMKYTKQVIAQMRVPPEVGREVAASASGKLYFQDILAYSVATVYERDASLRSRLVLVFSRDQELRWKNVDTLSLTAEHLLKFRKDLGIVSYESLVAQPGDAVFMVDRGRHEWLEQAFAASHAQVNVLRESLGKRAEVVRFVSLTSTRRDLAQLR